VNRLFLLILALMSLPFVAGKSLGAQSASDEKKIAEFYRGKTVTILVGHSAGGGFDTYARVISRHLGKHIPGNPAILVNNMPGAGTMISVNHSYNNAPRDGTFINSFDGGIVPQQLYGSKAVQFDLSKLNYIGAPDIFKYIMVVTKKSGITKMEDFLTGGKQITIGAVPNTGIQHASMLLREVLGANIKLVTGFKGTAEIRIAMKSAEVDSVIVGWETLRVTNSSDFETGEWLILSQWVDEPLTDLPQKNVPSIYQFTKTQEQRELFRLGLIKPNSYARPYALPPGVPAERVSSIEHAFQSTLRDPEFLAEAEKSKLTVNPISGAQLRSMVIEGLSMPASLKEKLRPILFPGN
jgi:tripartite-type tricarboxylate transporter receptor subunit TctC